jgi:hypothetical protein
MVAGNAFPFIYLEKRLVFVKGGLRAAAFRTDFEKLIFGHGLPLHFKATLHDH